MPSASSIAWIGENRYPSSEKPTAGDGAFAPDLDRIAIS
jgi:hypothetical protein